MKRFFLLCTYLIIFGVILIPGIGSAYDFHVVAWTSNDVNEINLVWSDQGVAGTTQVSNNFIATDDEGGLDYKCLMYQGEDFPNYHKELLLDLPAFQDYGDTDPVPYYYFEYWQRRSIDLSPDIECFTQPFAIAVNHSILNDADTNGGWRQEFKFNEITGEGTWELIRETLWIYDIINGYPNYNRYEQIYRGPDGRYYGYLPESNALYSVSNMSDQGFTGYHANYLYEYLSAQAIAIPQPTANFLYPEQLLLPGNYLSNTGPLRYGTGTEIDTFGYTSNLRPYTAPVPEPASLLLLGSGLVGLAGFRKRFFKK
jgi:hypothetical protein